MASPTTLNRLTFGKQDHTSWEKRRGRIFEEEELQILEAAIAESDIDIFKLHPPEVAAGTVHFQDALTTQGGDTLQPINTLTGNNFKDRTLNPVSLDVDAYLNGVVKPGKSLLVLGCSGNEWWSTVLEQIARDLNTMEVYGLSEVHYGSLLQNEIIDNYKKETAYNSEIDTRFSHRILKQTLGFAVAVRAPQSVIVAASQKEHIHDETGVFIAVYGLTETQKTRVGYKFFRGVFGGERKCVKIAKMIMSATPTACWDRLAVLML